MHVIEIRVPADIPDNKVQKLAEDLLVMAKDRVSNIYREKYVAGAMDYVNYQIRIATPNSRSTKDGE